MKCPGCEFEGWPAQVLGERMQLVDACGRCGQVLPVQAPVAAAFSGGELHAKEVAAVIVPMQVHEGATSGLLQLAHEAHVPRLTREHRSQAQDDVDAVTWLKARRDAVRAVHESLSRELRQINAMLAVAGEGDPIA